MKYKLFVCLLLISLGNGVDAESIVVHGSIVNQTPPNHTVKDARVFIQAKGNLLEANYDNQKGQYDKRLSSEMYGKENVIMLVQHSEFVQSNSRADGIKLKDAGKVEHHINVKTKKHLADTLVYSAKNSASKGDFVEALDKIDSAAAIYASNEVYSYKVRLLGDALLAKHTLPVRHSNIVTDGGFINYSKALNDIDRYKIFLQIGHVYTNVKNPEQQINDTTSYFDIAAQAYAEARAANPRNAKPYQGEYRLYEKTKNYYDAAKVIERFFSSNKNITRASTVRTFLSDWITNYEKVTGFPYSSTSDIQSNSEYRKMANELFKTILSYKSMFENDGRTDSKRIINALPMLKDIGEK